MANEHVRSRIVGPNVPTWERVVTGIAGGTLVAYGLVRRSALGAALAGAGAAVVARAIAGRCPAYRMRAMRKGVEVRRAITVQAPPREIYELWRTFTDEWGVEMLEDSPGRRLRWTVPHGPHRHDGTVDLLEAPGDRGTVLDVRLRYHPRGGLLVVGAASGILRDRKGEQLATELARIRQWLETGELATGAARPEERAS